MKSFAVDFLAVAGALALAVGLSLLVWQFLAADCGELRRQAMGSTFIISVECN
jgi:hypothetical protein